MRIVVVALIILLALACGGGSSSLLDQRQSYPIRLKLSSAGGNIQQYEISIVSLDGRHKALESLMATEAELKSVSIEVDINSNYVVSLKLNNNSFLKTILQREVFQDSLQSNVVDLGEINAITTYATEGFLKNLDKQIGQGGNVLLDPKTYLFDRWGVSRFNHLSYDKISILSPPLTIKSALVPEINFINLLRLHLGVLRELPEGLTALQEEALGRLYDGICSEQTPGKYVNLLASDNLPLSSYHNSHTLGGNLVAVLQGRSPFLQAAGTLSANQLNRLYFDPEANHHLAYIAIDRESFIVHGNALLNNKPMSGNMLLSSTNLLLPVVFKAAIQMGAYDFDEVPRGDFLLRHEAVDPSLPVVVGANPNVQQNYILP